MAFDPVKYRTFDAPLLSWKDVTKRLPDIDFKAERKDLSFEWEGAPRDADGYKAIVNGNTGDVLTVRTDAYSVIPHDVAIQKMMEDFDKVGAHIVGGGVWSGGQSGYFQFKKDDGASFNAGGEAHDAYVSVLWSYRIGHRLRSGCICIVCDNTFAMTFFGKKAGADADVRHIGDAPERAEAAVKAMLAAEETAQEYTLWANAAANVAVSPSATMAVLDDTFQAAGVVSAKAKVKAMAEFQEIFSGKTSNTGVAGHEGTLFGLWQAITFWADHDLAGRVRGKTDEAKAARIAESVVAGRANNTKEAVFELVYKLVDGSDLVVPVYEPEDTDEAKGRNILIDILNSKEAAA